VSCTRHNRELPGAFHTLDPYTTIIWCVESNICLGIRSISEKNSKLSFCQQQMVAELIFSANLAVNVTERSTPCKIKVLVFVMPEEYGL
jgi:hypothetical protein